MDSFSQISMDSENRSPRNVYVEVIVDSVIQPVESKNNTASEAASTSVDPKNTVTGVVSDIEDDTDDEESESISSRSSIPSPTVKVAGILSSTTIEKGETPSSDEQKMANLKLVLKKSPEYQLVNPSITQGKNMSNNKIFLVTSVSNVNTSQNYSTAKYSVAASDVKSSAASVSTNKLIETNESLLGGESKDTLKLEGSKQANDSIKPMQTYGKVATTILADTDEQKIDTGRITAETTNDTAEIELASSEIESKTSTPQISRELQQLQKTVNESKVLSEYINDSMGKSRKTRKMLALKGSDTEGSPVLQPIRSRSRSRSKPRLDSPTDNVEKFGRCPSEDKISKRQNMRSQNSEFVQKHMKFLNSLQGDEGSDNSDGETSITDGKSSSHSIAEHQHQNVAKRDLHTPPKEGWDMFCFKCHSGMDLIACSRCVRSFHAKCVRIASPAKTSTTWVCPECIAIENSLKCSSSRSVDNLNQLLQFALKRMKQSKGFELFLNGFNDEEYPEFSKFIIHPVTLEMLQNNIEKKIYKCTEEFAVEAKWILHNCSVYFGNTSKITNLAKGILKVCRQEVTEIDTCPECYCNANTRKDWFIEVCSKPHMLLWAKLKGFPYWPAKSMGSNGAVVNVRFFGDHDRAYVPVKECFLYSENDPNPPTKQNKKSIKECIKEVEIHIRKITTKFGRFVYPPFRTVYDPSKELLQLEMMIPGITESIKTVEKSFKPALTYKIVKTADNHLSIVRKEKDKVEDVMNASPIPINTPTAVSALIDTEKVSKLRAKSTDSSQSNKEVPSICGTGADTIAGQESSTEVKVAEKTVAPMKIQERINTESTTKTYEIVPKISDPEQAKVTSVILKRKSDNWNAVTVTTLKKPKLVAEAPEENTQPNKELSSGTLDIVSASSIATKPIQTIKRKRSREDAVAKPQKPKLDEGKIPPLAPLTPPFVISQMTSPPPIHPSANCLLPANTSLNSTVTVTITQSPALTSVASNDSSANKSASVALSTVLNFENSEISIKRLPKKQPAAQSATTSQVSKEKTDTVTLSNNQRESNAKIIELSKAIEKAMDKASVNRNQETNAKGNVAKKMCELIPFTEIKSETPDVQDASLELVEVRSKTTTPEQPASSNPNGNAINEELNNRPVLVKTEIMSDEEELSNASRLEENGDCESSPSISKSSDVRTTAKILPQGHVAIQKNAAVQNKAAGKPESKKQRARKSFPNKTNFNPVALANASSAPGIKRPAMPQSLLPQNNGMVYIPVDPKTSAVSMQVLTSTPTSSAPANSKEMLNSNVAATATIPISCNPILAGNAMSTSMTALSSTILTTSLQLPIVYSTIPMPSMNGPGSSQPNASAVQVTCSVQPNTPATSEQHMLSGFVTPTLASAITDAIVKGPPKLMAKPAGPLTSDGDFVFPSEAGPVSKMLMENAHKMTDFFRSVIEETLNDMSKNQNLEAKVKLLELELEKMKYTHEKEVAELKHNTDLMLCEMRKSLETEKTRLVAGTRKQCELERIRAVEEAKTKQWCASCGKEAQFYCCWNTSYCDYPCQQKHWARHMNACAQKDNNDANAQRVGVKIPPYNVKERQNKSKESAAQKLAPNTLTRAQFPATIRSPAPTTMKRIIVPTQTPPRYTLINGSECNWSVVPTPQFQRVFPTTGIIMSDSSNKPLPTSSMSLLRAPKM